MSTYIDLKKNRLNYILLIIVMSMLLNSCISSEKGIANKVDLAGTYVLKTDKLYQVLSDINYHSLNLNTDGTYILYKAEIKFTPVIEQCEIASKGKWAVLSRDVLELTSEDKYSKQKGFEYELKKENKLSQDSLYIKVNFPNGFSELPINLNFSFNYDNSKSFETAITLIAIPKSKHLLAKSSNSINRNHIAFYLTGNISCKSRTVFHIFEEDIDTEKTNYLTITLPNFDRCFIEFEPMNKELIYIKNNNQLFWKGNIWESEK